MGPLGFEPQNQNSRSYLLLLNIKGMSAAIAITVGPQIPFFVGASVDTGVSAGVVGSAVAPGVSAGFSVVGGVGVTTWVGGAVVSTGAGLLTSAVVADIANTENPGVSPAYSTKVSPSDVMVVSSISHWVVYL